MAFQAWGIKEPHHSSMACVALSRVLGALLSVPVWPLTMLSWAPKASFPCFP